MGRPTKHFSWAKREKQCNSCDEIKKLKHFREANNSTTDMRTSAFYSYICIPCWNDKARAYQQKKYAEKRKE
jgi:hypothetical protein